MKGYSRLQTEKTLVRLLQKQSDVGLHCLSRPFEGRFTFELMHNMKEQIYFYYRAENHKAKERKFKSFK